MKNFYYALTVSENGKNYSYVLKVSESNNLLAVLKYHKNLTIVHQCETKKKAVELVNFWNESYKANGTYMFDEITF